MSTLAVTRPAPPERSLRQRLEALEKGNRIRSQRAQLKRDMKAGRRRAGELIAAPPEFTDTMKIFDLLMGAPKVGRVKANKWLRTANISPSKTLGGLSPRQRAELVALIGDR